MKITNQGHLTALYMVFFQYTFLIFCSTQRSLKKFGCNWSAKGKETNSSLHTFTEQKIFDFLLTIFAPNSTTKLAVL